MKEAEFREAWLKFEREWKRKSEEEKEARLLEFIKAIKGENGNDGRSESKEK